MDMKATVEGLPLKKRGVLAAVAVGALMLAVPLSSAFSQEPPQPTSVPRNAVEKSPQIKKGDASQIKDAPDGELAPKPNDSAAADAAKTKPADNGVEPGQNLEVTRGRKRGLLLKKLQGGPEVVLESDPNNPPTVVEPLRIEEAVAFALKNNFEVLGAKARTTSAKWDKFGAYSEYAPTASLAVRDGKEESKPGSDSIVGANGAGVTDPDNTHHTWSNSLVVTQPVIDLSIISDIMTKSDSYDAVAADEVSTREKMAYDTIVSFLRVSRSRLSIGFAENYKQNLDKLAQRMRDRVSGGGAPGVELDRLTARSVTARSAIIEAHSEYQAAIVEFRRLTGVVPIKLLLPDALMPAVPGKVDEVLERTLKNNPDFRGASKRSEAAIGDMAKSFSSLLPKFSVEFSQSRSWNSGGVADTNAQTCTVATNCFFPNTRTTQLMGVLTWNLSPGPDIASGMSNRARAEAASYSANDLRQKLEESVRVGYDAMNSANSRIEAVSQAVDANAKVAVALEEQYMAGSRQLLDLLDAYERLYQSQTELTGLLVSEAQAGYLMRREMGELEAAILSPDKSN